MLYAYEVRPYRRSTYTSVYGYKSFGHDEYVYDYGNTYYIISAEKLETSKEEDNTGKVIQITNIDDISIKELTVGSLKMILKDLACVDNIGDVILEPKEA